jgi:hypothetical protein
MSYRIITYMTSVADICHHDKTMDELKVVLITQMGSLPVTSALFN